LLPKAGGRQKGEGVGGTEKKTEEGSKKDKEPKNWTGVEVDFQIGGREKIIRTILKSVKRKWESLQNVPMKSGNFKKTR